MLLLQSGLKDKAKRIKSKVTPMESIFFKSPVGWIAIRGDKKAIFAVDFLERSPELKTKKIISPGAEKYLLKAARELDEYFCGKRKRFTFRMKSLGTPFQNRVWQALKKIPHGQVVSYQFIALQMGEPKSSRAVGMANSKNPLGIVVPCHRVIGKNGKLVGYAGGLKRKRWLLKHEGQILA